MIPRIGALVFLALLFAGGTWYVLRDTPEKRVFRLREEARSLLRNVADLEQAEELNEEILKLIPGSLYDLVFKAELNELKGTAVGLKEALETYDQILASGVPNYLGVAFYKARVCRVLGLTAEARAALLSVMDQHPYLALMELGETAMVAVTPLDALRWFTRAREVAVRGADAARAREAEAGAYRLLLALISAPARAMGGSGDDLQRPAERNLEELREKARDSLTAALDFVRSPETPSSGVEARRWLLWAASLSEKLISVRRPEDKPCQDGAVLLDGKITAYAPILREDVGAARVSLGTLRLLAVRHEALHLGPGQDEEYRRLAEKDFLTALAKTPEEARSLLGRAAFPLGRVDGQARAVTQESQDALAYLQTLSAISRIYLATGESGRLLDDRSGIVLSRRLADVLDVADREVRGVFALLLGLARVHAGPMEEGRRLLGIYMDSVPSDRRPEAALETAEQLVRHVPGAPLAFEFVDLFREAGGEPLEFVGRRVSLLVMARGQDRLRDEASKRLDALLLAAAAEARSSLEITSVARVFLSVRGQDAALDFLRSARLREPRDFDVSWLLAAMLMEKARALEKTGPLGAEIDSYREALGLCLPLFIAAPTRSEDLLRATAEAARKLLARESERISAGILRPHFPAAPEAAVVELARILESYLLGRFGRALDMANAIGDPRSLIPFLSFLKGSCHVGLAGHLRREGLQARSHGAREALESQRAGHVRQAMAEFGAGLDFLANRLELLILELEDLPAASDVPDDLLRRIRELSESADAGHRGYFLLAQALHRRRGHRHGDPGVKNSEIARLIAGEQKALRNSIRRYPQFNAAYRMLADTFVLTERREAASERESPQREISTRDLKKAIDVLKAAPEPDEAILSALAVHLAEDGRAAEATPYIERLARLSPGAEVFWRLLENYLATDNPAARVFLQEGPAPLDVAGMTTERSKDVLDLRRAFETLPENQGIRLSFLGDLTAVQESKAWGEEKKRLRRRSIEQYSVAVEAYDRKGIQPPAVVLNNLAWYLAEDDDPSLCARAVEVAVRGKALAPDPSRMPNMHDTHAWALYRNGKLTDAERAFRTLIASVDRPTFRCHLARVLLGLRKYDDALEEILKARGAVEDFPEREEALRLETEIREARRRAIGE